MGSRLGVEGLRFMLQDMASWSGDGTAKMLCTWVQTYVSGFRVWVRAYGSGFEVWCCRTWPAGAVMA